MHLSNIKFIALEKVFLNNVLNSKCQSSIAALFTLPNEKDYIEVNVHEFSFKKQNEKNILISSKIC